MNKIFPILLLVLVITSCRTQKDVLYFQNIDNVNISTDNFASPKIQIGDVMSIVVSAYDEALAEPFNLGNVNNNRLGNSELSPITYLVDSEGNIEYPMLGTIKAAGKTRKELSEDLKIRIAKFIQDPMVNIRILNFKITTLGEFNSQGIVESPSERLNIMEAIAMSNGLSYYAIRDSILLIRTVDGKRTHNFVNLKDANLINSEYYYMKQNDILYALPTKSKAMEFNTQPLSATLSVIGFVATLIALFK